ncbi:MAG: hypothetical protein IPP29_07010 [Bacteroidetes bacterium]|nr:hypothetical protein [Bacteroidota bacterium]
MSIYVAHSQTNVYHPFPKYPAMWSVKWDGAWVCQDIDYFGYDDSTVNNIVYRKVWVTGIESICINQMTSDTISKYAGAYRNDTITKKVYWLEPDSLVEKLLYNFDVNVGDTLPLVMFNMYPITSAVIVKPKTLFCWLMAPIIIHWIGYAGQLGSFHRIIEA